MHLDSPLMFFHFDPVTLLVFVRNVIHEDQLWINNMTSFPREIEINVNLAVPSHQARIIQEFVQALHEAVMYNRKYSVSSKVLYMY